MSPATYVGDAWKMMLDAVGSILQEGEQEVLNSLTKFVDQLPSVMSEVCLNCCFRRFCPICFSKLLCVKGQIWRSNVAFDSCDPSYCLCTYQITTLNIFILVSFASI